MFIDTKEFLLKLIVFFDLFFNLQIYDEKILELLYGSSSFVNSSIMFKIDILFSFNDEFLFFLNFEKYQ